MNDQRETIELGMGAKKHFSLPKLLSVSPAPHIRSLDTTRSVMIDVIIALIPALIWGIFTFGIRAAAVVAVSIASAVLAEVIYELIMQKTITAADLSAVVTGLILGLSMPPAVALWVPCVGSVFAIVVVKQIFGGIGKNIVNPALCARVFLMLCWPEQMTKYIDIKTDLITGATPLQTLNSGTAPGVTLFNCVMGNTAGAIGEVSAIALAAGFVYLLVRKVVSWQLPLGFIGVVALLTGLFPNTGDNVSCMMYHIFTGGLLFCALICANDYATTPVTGTGKLIFGVGCGLVTVVIRYFGAYAEGCAFAVIMMNLLVSVFEAWTSPRRYGTKNELSNERAGGDAV